jgi:hypothetical protein
VPLIMRRAAFDFFPAARCTHCGTEFDRARGGYAAWPVDVINNPPYVEVQLLCCDDCLDAFSAEHEDDGEWIATPFAVYLANLIVTLGIDIDAVLETEHASVAAENTRDQAPD